MIPAVEGGLPSHYVETLFGYRWIVKFVINGRRK